ncbi:helix-turn-helix transcriptional regulator [Limosilactobacillus oris]|uniref:helix-turn-helix transcriptional regulator n=1 Tax=Limosilactobacillus oris TaxID=1632 RepID=UPI0019561E45|nr:helix-turn-helix transcriptional regulator [Limosilactobacillus oris]
MSLANRIKEARKSKRYTQKDLASLLNVKPATVSGWEVGRNEPSLDMLHKLSNVLGVSFEYLTGVVSQTSDDDHPLTRNQKLVAYSIDPDISDEERQDIIEMVKIAMKNRHRV